jgi:YHS domain-containing protein
VPVVLRIILLFVLAWLVARAFWRLVAGIIVGASVPPAAARRPRAGPPERGVQMVRDPVCGTFLPPGNALTLTGRGGAVHYFCSDACRQRFDERSSAR